MKFWQKPHFGFIPILIILSLECTSRVNITMTPGSWSGSRTKRKRIMLKVLPRVTSNPLSSSFEDLTNPEVKRLVKVYVLYYPPFNILIIKLRHNLDNGISNVLFSGKSFPEPDSSTKRKIEEKPANSTFNVTRHLLLPHDRFMREYSIAVNLRMSFSSCTLHILLLLHIHIPFNIPLCFPTPP